MYDYIVNSDRGGFHMCYTKKEALSIVESLNKIGTEAEVYKRMEINNQTSKS